MTDQTRARSMPPRQIAALLCCLVAAGIVALSIHVVMLAAGVPFPVSAPPAWARWLNSASTIAATLTVLHIGRARLDQWHHLSRLLTTFIILVTIRETFRGAIMGGVVTSAWTFSLVGMLPEFAGLFVLAVLCTIATTFARSTVSVIAATMMLAGAYGFVQASIDQALGPVIAHFAALAQFDPYEFPYPPIVMIPAYLTFAEPVLGATIVTALTWDRFPAGSVRRALIVALLVSFIKGVVIGTFLFSHFSEESFTSTVLGYSQFLLVFLALGFFVGLAWGRFGVIARAAQVGR